MRNQKREIKGDSEGKHTHAGNLYVFVRAQKRGPAKDIRAWVEGAKRGGEDQSLCVRLDSYARTGAAGSRGKLVPKLLDENAPPHVEKESGNNGLERERRKEKIFGPQTDEKVERGITQGGRIFSVSVGEGR